MLPCSSWWYADLHDLRDIGLVLGPGHWNQQVLPLAFLEQMEELGKEQHLTCYPIALGALSSCHLGNFTGLYFLLRETLPGNSWPGVVSPFYRWD